MKVCILGIARSGTTAVYSLLQEMMFAQIGLEKIKTSKAKTLIISHEYYIRNRNRNIKKICDFLNTNLKEKFFEKAAKNIEPMAKDLKLQ